MTAAAAVAMTRLVSVVALQPVEDPPVVVGSRLWAAAGAVPGRVVEAVLEGEELVPFGAGGPWCRAVECRRYRCRVEVADGVELDGAELAVVQVETDTGWSTCDRCNRVAEVVCGWSGGRLIGAYCRRCWASLGGEDVR